MVEEQTLEKIVHDLQLVAQQVATLQSQVREIQGTIEYLTTHDLNRPVYQQIGPLLVEIEDVATLIDELRETNEHLSNHHENLQKRELELRASYQSSSENNEN